MYIVVAGSGELSVALAEALMVEHEVVLIGDLEPSCSRAEKLDIELVGGSPTTVESLRRARTDKCKVFVAATQSDEQNIVACLAAQRLGAPRVLCLLTQPGFLTTTEQDEELARSIGVDAVIRPSEQLAQEVVRIATVPGALDVEYFAGGRVHLLRHVVEPGARISRQPIKDARLPDEVALVMLKRGDQLSCPNGNTQFQVGDKVTAVGTPSGIRQLLYHHLRAADHGRDAHVATIVGGGHVGFLVTQGLERAGWQVKVIEQDRGRCETLATRLRSLVLHGDGTDMDLLEEEQAGEASVLIAVTDNDEKNLLVSLMARSLGVRRVITRAERLANERMFERVGVDVVRSAHGAAIRTVVRRIVGAQAEIRAELEHGDVRVVELELPDDYPDVRLGDLKTSLFAIVGAILRGREVIIPRGNTRLRPKDHLLIFCTADDEARGLELFRRPPTVQAEPE